MLGRVAPGAVALLLLALAGGAFFAWRAQQAANRAVLARLDEVRAALSDESRRSRELADQVSALGQQVGRLEVENRDLRRQAARSARRPAVEAAPPTVPEPLVNLLAPPFAEHSPAAESGVLVDPLPITWSTDFTPYQDAGLVAPAPPVAAARTLTDPAFFRKMYITYGALQAADVASTLASINRGAREANPLLQGAVNNPAAFIGVKAAATAATVLVAERLRKRSPKAAIVTLIAINSTLAVVTAHNARVAASQP